MQQVRRRTTVAILGAALCIVAVAAGQAVAADKPFYDGKKNEPSVIKYLRSE